VRNFAKLRTKDIYPGVDVIYYGDNRRLEFDFVVAPMADPRAIALTLSGMDKLYINADGELVAEVNGHPVTFAKPYAYQKVTGSAKAVSVEYALAGPGKAQLQIGDYDKNLELVIDPVLSYSTYLGGTQADTANGIAVDLSGNAYITGQTSSIGKDASPVYFPGGPNATGPKGASYKDCNAYVTKLDPTGATVLFTTFIAGVTSNESGCASGNGIALDNTALNATPSPNGYPNVYVVGSTNFPDMPLAGSYNGGDHDAFIVILNSVTGALIRSTYLGGGSDDQGYAIAVDPQQNVIVAGQTASFDFPAYNGFEPIVEKYVAFVTKLDFGLHIDRPSAVAPLLYGSSPMSYRHASATDSCGNGSPCPATPNPNLIYYFFSAVYGGQLVAPSPTWPFDYVKGVVIGSWMPTGTVVPTVNNQTFTVGAVPYGAITVGTPTGCPSLTQTYPALILFAQNAGNAVNLEWGTCNSSTIGGVIYDDGGVNWEILAVAPFIEPLYATTEAYGVALDPIGDVYVVGGTNTAELHPSLPGPAPANGGIDWLPQADTHYAGTGAWIIKLLGHDTTNSAKNAGWPVYLTALGTNQTDVTQTVNAARGVAVDSEGRATVVGTTTGGLHPASVGLNPSPIGAPPTTDAFLLRMNAAGSGIEYVTYLGGTGNDQGLAVAVDAGGWAYVAGSTQSTNIPLKNPIVVDPVGGATQNSLGGVPPNAQDAYLVALSPDGTELIMSAYLGGSTGADQANAIALSPSGNGDIYVAGNTGSSDFPLMPLAPLNPVIGRSAYAGDGDVFVSKILGASFPAVTVTPLSLNFGNQTVGFSSSTTKTITLQSTGPATLNITSITGSAEFSETNTCGARLSPAGGANTTCTITVTFTPSSYGSQTGVVTIVDDATNSPQSVSLQGFGTLVQDSVSPTSLNFGTITLGAPPSAAQTVTVTNTDPTQTLIISTTNPPITGDFSVSSNTCNTSLTAGQSCAIGVIFTPVAPGSRIGTLVIPTANGNSSLSVQLTGIGNGAGSVGGTGSNPSDLTLTASPTAVTVAKGTQQTITVTLTAPAGFSQNVTLACTATGGATCTVTQQPQPNPVTGAAPSTATVSVSVPAGNTITISNLIRPGRLLATLLPFGGIGLIFAGRRRRWLLMLGLVVCLALGMVSCGGGGGSSSSSQTPQVKVTATTSSGTAQCVVALTMQ
jgi:hypothetical protein